MPQRIIGASVIMLVALLFVACQGSNIPNSAPVRSSVADDVLAGSRVVLITQGMIPSLEGVWEGVSYVDVAWPQRAKSTLEIVLSDNELRPIKWQRTIFAPGRPSWRVPFSGYQEASLVGGMIGRTDRVTLYERDGEYFLASSPRWVYGRPAFAWWHAPQHINRQLAAFERGEEFVAERVE